MLCLAALVALSIGLHAQAAQAQGAPAVPVLRAYVNVVQVPVLVLTERRLRAEPLAEGQFRMRIDGGPKFSPHRVRQEGLDPIRLILLVDAGPRVTEMLGGVDEALNGLAKNSLHAQDMVSVGVLRGCQLVQISAVAGRPEGMLRLEQFVHQELQTAQPVGAGTCAEDGRHADAIRLALERFADTRSRRVLVLLTDGEDAISRKSMLVLHDLAVNGAVSIFALRERSAEAARRDTRVLSRDSFAYVSGSTDGQRDTLVDLTELTGGMTLETRGHPLEESLERVLRLVRERYILEFARPAKISAGRHLIEVEVQAKRLYVRSAGVGVPLPDPAAEADPNRVPSDRSAEPPVGTRRMLPR